MVAAAIAGGLPYYDTTAEGTVDLGAEGWRQWLKEQRTSADDKVSDGRQPAAYVPEPAPWEV